MVIALISQPSTGFTSLLQMMLVTYFLYIQLTLCMPVTHIMQYLTYLFSKSNFIKNDATKQNEKILRLFLHFILFDDFIHCKLQQQFTSHS